MSATPYWLGDAPVSVVANNSVATTVNGSNVNVNLVPTILESGAAVNRKANPNATAVSFVSISNLAPGYYMGCYAFNTDANGTASFGANDTMEYYFQVGGAPAVYTLIRPNNCKTNDTSEDCYITGCAGFSNPTTQTITLTTYYTGTSAGVSTTCLFASIQKIA